jgi:hypothetical protein
MYHSILANDLRKTYILDLAWQHWSHSNLYKLFDHIWKEFNVSFYSDQCFKQTYLCKEYDHTWQEHILSFFSDLCSKAKMLVQVIWSLLAGT